MSKRSKEGLGEAESPQKTIRGSDSPVGKNISAKYI
jgi:hypothetical protein